MERRIFRPIPDSHDYRQELSRFRLSRATILWTEARRGVRR
jgi:hypothetical protein